MFDDAELKMMELAGKGYCCTQTLVLLALDETGRDNPDLVRAAAGLCHGTGDCSGTCGVLTGAAMVLAMHAGKGTDMEEQEDTLPLMLEALRDWFAEVTRPYGGIRCADILDGDCGTPDPDRCGGLISTAHEKVRSILVENGLDPAQGRAE